MSALNDRIADDLKRAMRARDRLRLDTLRSALSGFTYKRSENGRELNEQDETDVVRRLVKQRGESAAEFDKASRPELAAKERAEAEILAAYLPAQKNGEEVRSFVRQVLAGLPTAERSQGAAMKAVMPGLKGLADGNLVRTIVAEELERPQP